MKSGQYIFVSLEFGGREFSIEHIEFYMKETKEEILLELIENLTLLNLNESRVSKITNWLGNKLKVEINENNDWVDFGYPGEEIRRRTSA